MQSQVTKTRNGVEAACRIAELPAVAQGSALSQPIGGIGSRVSELSKALSGIHALNLAIHFPTGASAATIRRLATDAINDALDRAGVR